MEIKKQTNLRGELTVPGDKSISHRAVMFGSLAQILSPRICQSCMNPEKITIYPLEIEYFGEKVFFTDHYSVKEWKKGDPLPEIHEWYPHIKKARCNPCRNCGRC